MLLVDLGDVWLGGELQGLTPAVWERRRGGHHRLPLVHTVAEREHVLPPACVVRGGAVRALDLVLEGAQLPVLRVGAHVALVAGAGGHDADALQQRRQLWQELVAGQLDPATLRVRYDDNLPVLLGRANGVQRDSRDLGEPLSLSGGDVVVPLVEAQLLHRHPGGRQDGVVPVEDDERLVLRAVANSVHDPCAISTSRAVPFHLRACENQSRARPPGHLE
mmetsp:Transcript_41980/g.112708  ORF Transcript_41980/g.112708 Transcript_41980/m.112708 type:complete len:220 (-) Transcript_41980:27-686(-)